MTRFALLVSACGLAAMLALQGCGGGGGGGGGGGATTTVTTTVTTSGTTTSPRLTPNGLRYCEDVSTYYRVNIDENGVKTAAGQCLPSTCPGAYYTKPGEKDPDGKGDRQWMCFNPSMDKTQWTNEEAQKQHPPFEGACMFEDYGSNKKPSQVETCDNHLSHHPAACSPGPSTFWGACWSSKSENWKCIPKKDPTIDGLAKGDCKSQVVLDDSGSPTSNFFDGVCTFPEEQQKTYKCDTVPGYSSASAHTCGGGEPGTFDKACFALTSTPWICKGKDESFDTPCDWTTMPDSKAFYRGACVFSDNKGYKDAADASGLKPNAAAIEPSTIV